MRRGKLPAKNKNNEAAADPLDDQSLVAALMKWTELRRFASLTSKERETIAAFLIRYPDSLPALESRYGIPQEDLTKLLKRSKAAAASNPKALSIENIIKEIYKLEESKDLGYPATVKADYQLMRRIMDGLLPLVKARCAERTGFKDHYEYFETTIHFFEENIDQITAIKEQNADLWELANVLAGGWNARYWRAKLYDIWLNFYLHIVALEAMGVQLDPTTVERMRQLFLENLQNLRAADQIASANISKVMRGKA